MVNVVVTVSDARATGTGASFRGLPGVDLDVCVTVDGSTLPAGEVTLLPGEGTAEGSYAAWGSPENWISGALLDALKVLPKDDFAAVLSEIEMVASRRAGDVPS